MIHDDLSISLKGDDKESHPGNLNIPRPLPTPSLPPPLPPPSIRPPFGCARSSINTDLGCIANDLRRITALQTEFGAFVSLATIRARGGSGGRATGGPGCWRVLKERLSGLEALFHEAQVCLRHAYAPVVLLPQTHFAHYWLPDPNVHTCCYLIFTRPPSLGYLEYGLGTPWQAVLEVVFAGIDAYFEQKQ